MRRLHSSADRLIGLLYCLSSQKEKQAAYQFSGDDECQARAKEFCFTLPLTGDVPYETPSELSSEPESSDESSTA